MGRILSTLMEPAILWVQYLFLAPAGFSNQVIFLSKNLKIFCSTFFFGGAVVNVNIFKRNKNSRSFFIGIALGTVAVFILLDRRFIYIFVSQWVFPAFPFLEDAVTRPIIRISTVFAAGVLVQSAQFPPVVSIFYACLLALSGIWRDIFLGEASFGFLLRNQKGFIFKDFRLININPSQTATLKIRHLLGYFCKPPRITFWCVFWELLGPSCALYGLAW